MTAPPAILLIDGPQTLIVSLLVLLLGKILTQRIGMLSRYSFPSVFVGALLCSVIVWLVYELLNLRVEFADDMRDLLLLVFFSTIGLSTRVEMLRDGGRAIVVLLILEDQQTSRPTTLLPSNPDHLRVRLDNAISISGSRAQLFRPDFFMAVLRSRERPSSNLPVADLHKDSAGKRVAKRQSDQVSAGAHRRQGFRVFGQQGDGEDRHVDAAQPSLKSSLWPSVVHLAPSGRPLWQQCFRAPAWHSR